MTMAVMATAATLMNAGRQGTMVGKRCMGDSGRNLSTSTAANVSKPMGTMKAMRGRPEISQAKANAASNETE